MVRRLLRKGALFAGAVGLGFLSLGAGTAQADEPGKKPIEERVTESNESQYKIDFAPVKTQYDSWKKKQSGVASDKPEGMTHATYEAKRKRMEQWRSVKNRTYQVFGDVEYRKASRAFNTRIGFGKHNPSAEGGITGKDSTWQVFGTASRGSGTSSNDEKIKYGAGFELAKIFKGKQASFGINAGGDAGTYGGKGHLYASLGLNSQDKKTSARLTVGGEAGVDTTETINRRFDDVGSESEVKTDVTQRFGQANLDFTRRFDGGNVTVSSGVLAGRVDTHTDSSISNSGLYGGPAFHVNNPDVKNRIDVGQAHVGATLNVNNDAVASAFYLHNRTWVHNEDPAPSERRISENHQNTGVFNVYGNVGKWTGMRPNLWLGARAMVNHHSYEGGGSIILSNVGKQIAQENANPTNNEAPERALRRATIANDFNWAVQVDGVGGRNNDQRMMYGRVQGRVTLIPTSTYLGKISLTGGFERQYGKSKSLEQNRSFVGTEFTTTDGTTLYGNFEYMARKVGGDDFAVRAGARQYFNGLVLK
jgi:hypothetical protein